MPKFQVKPGAKHYWKKSVKRGKSDKVLENKLLVAGDIIECEEWELGSARDKFLKIDVTEERVEPQYGFSVVKVADGQYDVVSMKTGRKINNRRLSFKEARELVNKQAEDKDNNEGDDN